LILSERIIYGIHPEIDDTLPGAIASILFSGSLAIRDVISLIA